MRSGATPIWISRRRTASARRCDTSRLWSMPRRRRHGPRRSPTGRMTHQPSRLRLERNAAARAELGTAVAEEHAVADLALEFGRLAQGGAQAACALRPARASVADWSHQSGPMPRAVRPTRSGRTWSALPRSRMPRERQDCAGIGAKLWLCARCAGRERAARDPAPSSQERPHQFAEETARAYERASWRLLSTVWARRFCDQQEMSLQTATGRSLP